MLNDTSSRQSGTQIDGYYRQIKHDLNTSRYYGRSMFNAIFVANCIIRSPFSHVNRVVDMTVVVIECACTNVKRHRVVRDNNKQRTTFTGRWILFSWKKLDCKLNIYHWMSLIRSSWNFFLDFFPSQKYSSNHFSSKRNSSHNFL